MFSNPILAGLLTRYAVAAVSSAAVSAATFASTQWGWSAETIALIGGGLVALAVVVLKAISANKDIATQLGRWPVVDMLQAVASATGAKVKRIELWDAKLAADVPSPKVVAATPDPAGGPTTGL